MLTRTFLTAKELHCSEIERQAALEVLDMLERGELQYAPVRFSKSFRPFRGSVPADAFNISCWPLCMGGWMEQVKGRALSVRCQERWADLFEPTGFAYFPDYYTPERCARALHAKLTTGRADWDETAARPSSRQTEND